MSAILQHFLEGNSQLRQFLQGNVPLKHLLNAKSLFISNAFNEVSDWVLNCSTMTSRKLNVPKISQGRSVDCPVSL